MLGIPVRYLLKHPHAGTDLTADPRDTWARLCESYFGKREWRIPPFPYEPETNWERQLHALVGADWPCQVAHEFWDLWTQVMGELETLGIRPGPESFRDWNDGDAGLVRSIWCMIRHLHLKYIVETGVAHGVTSRFILEALARNGDGHLWSIDVPPLESAWRKKVGIAVASPLQTRWTYIKGTSRLRLPELLSKLGEVDLFVHDSLHTERNVRFELDQAWGTLRPGSALVVDDIDANWGFRSFTQAYSGHCSFICEAEPIRPDLRRSNNKGMFGIIVKPEVSSARIGAGRGSSQPSLGTRPFTSSSLN